MSGGTGVKRFIDGQDRGQLILLPESLDDYVGEDNPVRVVEAFIDELDLAVLGFAGVVPEATGRPSYHPATLLKIYLYGYLNRIASSRRLEREAQRNMELMWLTGRLMPDFKTIADFRRDNGPAIQATCRQFVLLCRKLGLFSDAVVGIDGSKFKAVNNRDKNLYPLQTAAPARADRSQHRALPFGDGGGRSAGERDSAGEVSASGGKDCRAPGANAAISGDGGGGPRCT